MSIPVYCATSKLSNFFQTSSSFLPNVTPHTAIAVQFSRVECYIDAVFWTSSWRRSSCHCRWDHTTTKVYIFVLFVEFFVEHGDHTTFYKLRQISLGLTDQWMSNKSCYIFHSDWLPRQWYSPAVFKNWRNFPSLKLEKSRRHKFLWTFFFKIKPYKPWLLGKHGAIWFQREEACTDLDRSC